jgi:hypothetical protein
MRGHPKVTNVIHTERFTDSLPITAGVINHILTGVKVMKRTNLIDQVQQIAVSCDLMEPDDGAVVIKIWLEQVGTATDGSPIYTHRYTIEKESQS